MREICNNKTILVYPGVISGTVVMQSDLMCSMPKGHPGMHKVVRWTGNVKMTAEWD